MPQNYGEKDIGRNGRAAEGARLESVLTPQASRGFESLFLRRFFSNKDLLFL